VVRFLLDTNIIIALLNGDGAVISIWKKLRKVFIRPSRVGELFFGAQSPAGQPKTYDRIERFASAEQLLHPTSPWP